MHPRDAFQRLRSAELARIPSFHRMWADAGMRASRNRRRRLMLLPVAVMIVVVLVSAPILYRMRVQESRSVFLSTTRWRGPTDFLLETPGNTLHDTVPTFATVPDYTKVTR